ARLEVVVVAIHEKSKAGFNVIAQPVIQSESRRYPELVLSKEAEIAVIQVYIEIRRLRRQEGVLPGGWHRRRSGIGIEWTGADGRTPEEGRYTRRNQTNQRRRAWR